METNEGNGLEIKSIFSIYISLSFSLQVVFINGSRQSFALISCATEAPNSVHNDRVCVQLFIPAEVVAKDFVVPGCCAAFKC